MAPDADILSGIGHGVLISTMVLTALLILAHAKRSSGEVQHIARRHHRGYGGIAAAIIMAASLVGCLQWHGMSIGWREMESGASRLLTRSCQLGGGLGDYGAQRLTR